MAWMSAFAALVVGESSRGVLAASALLVVVGIAWLSSLAAFVAGEDEGYGSSFSSA